MARQKKVPEDLINHPAHYQSRTPLPVEFDGVEAEVALEVADVIERFEPQNSHRAHTLTYALRAGRKKHPGLNLADSEIQDLNKAIWWLKREIRFKGGEVAESDD